MQPSSKDSTYVVAGARGLNGSGHLLTAPGKVQGLVLHKYWTSSVAAQRGMQAHTYRPVHLKGAKG